MKPHLPHSRRNLVETAFGLGCLLSLSSAHAALTSPVYWDGANGGWDNPANWSTVAGATTPDPSVVAGAGDDAVFNIDPVDGAVVVAMNAAQSAKSLVFFNTGTTALEGGGVNQVLTLGAAGIDVDAAAGAVTVGSATAGQNVAITLAASQTWTNPSANTLTIANGVTSAATGIQTLTVAGSGNTTINGTLNDGATGTLNLTKTGAGYLRLGGGNTDILGALDIQGGTVGSTSDFLATGLTGSGTFENGTANDKWSFWNIVGTNTFNGIVRNGGAGLLGFVKRGTGTLTLTNNGCNVTSNVQVEGGRLVLNNTGTFGSMLQGGLVRTGHTAVVGSVAGQNGVFEINGAAVNYNCRAGTAAQDEVYRATLSVGTNGTSAGALKMTAGSLTLRRQLGLGTVAGSYGACSISGGSANVGGFLAMGLGTGRGLFNQSGGDYTMTGPVTNGAGAGGFGVISLSGTAVYNQSGTGDNGIWLGESGTGVLNVSGSAALNFAATNNGLRFGVNAAGVGIANLRGGTVTTPALYRNAGSGTLNFNGGTLAANKDNATFLTGLTGAYVHAGGGTIDNGGKAITIAQPLLAPTGNGVSATGLTVGGTGFIDTPLVTITGGGGTGATAVANVDASGALTGITITNPGINYTSAPAFALGGGGVGNTGSITGTATLVANTSGGLTFTGAGTTTLTGADTFTGPIAVNGSKLALGGNHSANALSVSATGTLIVADPAAAVGTLTVSSLSLPTGSTVIFETGGGTASDKIVTTTGTRGNVNFTLYDTGTTNAATAGTYTLIQYSGSFTAGIAGLSVTNQRVGYSYAFQDTGSAITLTVASVDSDGDGMSDAYETANGLNPNDATGNNGKDGNLDGDFATNYEEFIAGTAANNAASDPLNTDNDGLRDNWEVTNFGNITAQTGSDDFDGDFDTNLLEFNAGTQPANAASFSDADSDGMGDGWETLYFTNITAKNGTVDSDGDLFTDLQEYKYGSNPADSSFSQAFAKATHRWSFTGNLNDSVGTSHATIQNGTTSNTNVVTQNATDVKMAGGVKADSQWVKLGNSLLPARNTPCTIELWATMDQIQNWSRVFDFHSGTAENLYMSWTTGTTAGTNTVEWRDAALSTSFNSHTLTEDVKHHIVMTIEPAPLAGSSVVKWYSAPAYDGSSNLEIGPARKVVTVANSLGFFNETVAALGYSPWPDNTASATYDEFRIWDGAMAEWAVQGLYEQGPDNASQPDSDNDKLPDSFEKFYFEGLAQGPNSDPDHDLSTNLQELIAGSDPSDPMSSPNDSDADGLPDAWEMEYFSDLDETGTSDPDGDFATNEQELAATTSPASYVSFPDSDNDGMSDGWENNYLTDLSDDGTGDSDGDGFNSKSEFDAKTAPNNPMSPGAADGDGDNDGLPDRWETTWFNQTTLLTQNGTTDSDGDGASNLAEYEATSKPNDAASTPTDINGDGTADQHVFHGMTATGSGPQDKDGQATTFSARLAGTGTTIPTVDPNLDLNTTAGTLSLTTSPSDINGQVNMAALEALGIPLSSLGFTGNQDIRIRAHYVNLPVLGGYDQIGAWVGTSSTMMTRAGVIFGNYVGLGVNTNGTADSNPFFGTANTAGSAGHDLTVVIERINGVWSMSCNGVSCTATAQPTFLDGLATLQAGVYVLDQNARKTATLESFTAVSFGGASGDTDNDGMDDAWETANLGNKSSDGTTDFDKDGTIDLLEFAFNGNPNNGGSRGSIATALLDTNGNSQKELTLTIAVRSGASFATQGDGSQTATVGGLTYKVRGSLNLTDFTSPVSHVTTQVSGDPAYELHTFRLNASEGLGGKGFLQAGATHP